MKNNKKKNSKKKSFNMYAWTHKNKKVFAGIICTMIVLGMLASLLQI